MCIVENNWAKMTIAVRSVWEVLHNKLAKNKTSGGADVYEGELRTF